MTRKIEEYKTEYLKIDEACGKAFLQKAELLQNAKNAMTRIEFKSFLSSPAVKLKERQAYYYIDAKDFAKKIQTNFSQFEKKITAKISENINTDNNLSGVNHDSVAPEVQNLDMLMAKLNLKQIVILEKITDDSVLQEFLVELLVNPIPNHKLKRAIEFVNLEKISAKESLERVLSEKKEPKTLEEQEQSLQYWKSKAEHLKKENEIIKKKRLSSTTNGNYHKSKSCKHSGNVLCSHP